MPAVERRELRDAEPLGSCDHRRVDGPEATVPVRSDELGDPEPVGCVHGLDRECARSQIAEEPHLGLHAETSRKEIGDLRDDEDRDDERARMGLEELE
jgi:hypothetical protein